MKKNCKIALSVTLAATILVVSGCAGQPKQESPAVTTAVVRREAESAEETPITPQKPEMPQTPETPETPARTVASDETATAYLKTYFDVEFSGGQVDVGSFSAALKQVAGEEAPGIEGDLSWLSAVEAAVETADFAELALSYSAEKATERLAFYGIDVPGEAVPAAALACALDVALITSSEAKQAIAGEIFTVADAEQLLIRIAVANGDGRNYLGMASDPAIYGKIDQAWNSFLLFDDGKLSEVGREAVQQEITTGYGIKSAAYSARFLPELTLQYGHSEIKHAHQLIGLLNSERIDAKVQLEPKVSIYQYLLEWGPVPEATPTYEVKKYGDLYLVYAVEYDMQLEFNNQMGMKRFDEVIKNFAKKNEGNEEAIGLIADSWWQPLYSTTEAQMPAEDYHQIFDCVVTNGMYSIHPFTMPADKEAVVEKLKALAGDLEVTPVERYCNTAFYNYLSGEDHQ